MCIRIRKEEEVSAVLDDMTNLRDRVQDFDEQVSGSTEDMDVDELEAELGIHFEEDANINAALPDVPKSHKPQGKAYAAVHNTTPALPKDDDLDAMIAELAI